jgi:dienelactone hydrolase
MLLPGCVGTQPFEREWARDFARAGYVALIVDSFTPRGVTSREALDGVCEGDYVWGFERAGDLLVSLDRLRTHAAVAADRLALAGWSHGAWAVMDAVALGASGARPRPDSDAI